MGRARRADRGGVRRVFVNAFNPHRIIIGGAIAEAQGERLLGLAQDTIAREASRGWRPRSASSRRSLARTSRSQARSPSLCRASAIQPGGATDRPSGHRSRLRAPTCPFTRPASAGRNPTRRIPNHGNPGRHQRLRPDRSPVAQGPHRARPRRRGRGGQRPRRHEHERAAVQARLDVRRLSRRRRPHRRRADRRRPRDQGPQGEGPGRPAVGRSRGGHRGRVDRPLHRRREGPRAHRRRREEGHHQRAGEGRGHHDRPRRQRREVRPGDPPHHQQRQLHDELPRAGGEGGPRPARHRARADEHDPQLHERPAHPRRRAQGPAPRPVGRSEHHPDDDRRREGARARHPRPQGQVRRVQPARPDADGERRRLHRRGRSRDVGRGAERGVPRRRRRAR